MPKTTKIIYSENHWDDRPYCSKCGRLVQGGEIILLPGSSSEGIAHEECPTRGEPLDVIINVRREREAGAIQDVCRLEEELEEARRYLAEARKARAAAETAKADRDR